MGNVINGLTEISIDVPGIINLHIAERYIQGEHTTIHGTTLKVL